LSNELALLCLGKKAFDALCALSESQLNCISFVVVGRDKEIANDYSSELIEFCRTKRIQVVERRDSDGLISSFNGFKIAIGWRWLIKDSHNLLVFHDSLLPKYRGFSPVVNCLINGERKLGASVLFACDEYDKGPIINQASISVTYPIKVSNAIDMVGKLYSQLLADLLGKIKNNESLSGYQQNESEASYSLWRDTSDYAIDWYRSAAEIVRFIDAVDYPYRGAECKADGRLIRISDAIEIDDVLVHDRKNAIGKVIFMNDGRPVVVCGQGLLKISSALDSNGQSIFPLKKIRIRFQ